MSLPSWGVFYALLFFIFFRTASAQPATTAVCGSNFKWMNNHDGQNPCLVAAYAFSACMAGVALIIPAVNETSATTYAIPTGNSVTPCGCSSVTYSLLFACSFCQGAGGLDWATWTRNCPADEVSQGFPNDVDMGALIPPWAYQSIIGEFNVQIAQDNATAAVVESSGTGSMPTSSSLSVPSTVPASTSSTSLIHTSSSSAVSSSSTMSTASTSSMESWTSVTSSAILPSSTNPSVHSTTSLTTAITYTVIPTDFVPTPSSSSTSNAAPSVSPSVAGDSTGSSNTHKTDLTALIGGSVGGGVGVLLVVGLVVFSLHVRRKQKEEDRVMAPYRVDGLRLYDPEDETTYPKPEWPTVPAYSDRRSIVQLHDPGHRLVPTRPALIPEV